MGSEGHGAALTWASLRFATANGGSMPTPTVPAIQSLLLSCALSMGASALLFVPAVSAQTGGWPTHSHDEQHTALSTVESQPVDRIHWHTTVDLDPPQGEILIHYGSPLVTPANTVIVPIKTGADSFRVEAHNGATGELLWKENTGWQAPSAGFVPGLGPTLSGQRLFIPDIAGRLLTRENPDEATGTSSHLYFYGAGNYAKAPTAYQQNVQINTPITNDAQGNVYFGFAVLGPTPLNLRGGIARIAADGTGTWTSAAAASNDASITQVATSAAPALSVDGKTLYVVVDNGLYGDLLALNSETLAPLSRVRLIDPASGLDATLCNCSSATPTVGPDGDVYFGVLENPLPSHNERGWLLHFNGDLSETKIPGSFGWDDTPSVVPATLVASYRGKSKYLLMTKYNNYYGIGTGNGENKIAILDPNATEDDPILSKTQVMKEVLTKLGVTPDPPYDGVKEWCINTAAVDPFTKSILVNSEDGYIYRWDLTNNTLSQKVKLSSGIGEAYTPTVIGADGTVYAINDAVLDALGK